MQRNRIIFDAWLRTLRLRNRFGLGNRFRLGFRFGLRNGLRLSNRLRVGVDLLEKIYFFNRLGFGLDNLHWFGHWHWLGLRFGLHHLLQRRAGRPDQQIFHGSAFAEEGRFGGVSP